MSTSYKKERIARRKEDGNVLRMPQPERPKPPPEVLRWHGEPERICGNCEHYDGGGLGPNGPLHVEGEGDCHNGISGRFQTKRDGPACARGFYPCTTRFPIHELMGIKP